MTWLQRVSIWQLRHAAFLSVPNFYTQPQILYLVQFDGQDLFAATWQRVEDHIVGPKQKTPSFYILQFTCAIWFISSVEEKRSHKACSNADAEMQQMRTCRSRPLYLVNIDSTCDTLSGLKSL